jgi:hypothetical protein
MTHDQFLYPSQFRKRESEILRKSHGSQPEFCRKIVPINVDVGRLIRLVAVEVKAVWTMSPDSRHATLIAKTSGSGRQVRPGRQSTIRIIADGRGKFHVCGESSVLRACCANPPT